MPRVLHITCMTGQRNPFRNQAHPLVALPRKHMHVMLSRNARITSSAWHWPSPYPTCVIYHTEHFRT